MATDQSLRGERKKAARSHERSDAVRVRECVEATRASRLNRHAVTAPRQKPMEPTMIAEEWRSCARAFDSLRPHRVRRPTERLAGKRRARSARRAIGRRAWKSLRHSERHTFERER